MERPPSANRERETLTSLLTPWTAALKRLDEQVQNAAAQIRALPDHRDIESVSSASRARGAAEDGGALAAPLAAAAAFQAGPAVADDSGARDTAQFLKTVAMHVLKFVAKGTEEWRVDAHEAEVRVTYLVRIAASLYVQSGIWPLPSAVSSVDCTARTFSALLTLYGKGFSLIGTSWCTAMLTSRAIKCVKLRTNDAKLHGVGYVGGVETRHLHLPNVDCSVLDSSHVEAVTSEPAQFDQWHLLKALGDTHRAACAIVQSGFDASVLLRLLTPGTGCSDIKDGILPALEACACLHPWRRAHGERAKQYKSDLVAVHDGRSRESILDQAFATHGTPDLDDVEFVLAGFSRFDDGRRVALKWCNLFGTRILARLLQSADICDNLVAACHFITERIDDGHAVFGSDAVEITCRLFAKLMVDAAVALQPGFKGSDSSGINPDLIFLWEFGASNFPALWRDAIRDRLSSRSQPPRAHALMAALSDRRPSSSRCAFAPSVDSSSSMTFNALTFTDGLTGSRVSLALVAADQLQTPAQLRAQIMRPLLLVQAAAWSFTRQSPGRQRPRGNPPPPLGHMLTEFSPRVPARVMFGCVATACRRLAAAPAGVFVISRTTGRWAAWILERVTAGLVMKVQVRLQRRACCAVRCVTVTRTAGHAGWFAGALLFVCAAVAWARAAAFILVCRLLLPPALQAVPTF
jgi:hypothetical protein